MWEKRLTKSVEVKSDYIENIILNAASIYMRYSHAKKNSTTVVLFAIILRFSIYG